MEKCDTYVVFSNDLDTIARRQSNLNVGISAYGHGSDDCVATELVRTKGFLLNGQWNVQRQRQVIPKSVNRTT